MDWKSKEFLLTAFLLLIASIALFVQPIAISFVEFGTVAGGILTFYTTARTVQKVKANGNGG